MPAEPSAGLKPTIDVCVATYKRPELLKKLLLSLAAQETEGEFAVRIIVVDNDADRSAAAAVRAFSRQAEGRAVLYDVECERNISLARNRAIAHATANYIATIDDDECADPRWLLNLYRTLLAEGADVVFGPVLPVFHPAARPAIRNSGAFELPNPPTGTTENYVYVSGNSLFRRSLIEGVCAPFDPSFGRTGGGDTAFFNGLKRRGCRLVWCREAPVFEFVPPEKTTWRWVFQREFRRGNGYYRLFDPPAAASPVRRARQVVFLGRAMTKLLWPVPGYLARGRSDARRTREAIRRLRRVASHTGKIAYLMGYQYEEYRAR